MTKEQNQKQPPGGPEDARELLKNQCDGEPCIGTGVGYQVVHAACPDPCDPDRLKVVVERAKASAYREAQAKCTGHELCMCVGDYSELIPAQCVKIDTGGGREGCLYFTAWAYVGRCRIVI